MLGISYQQCIGVIENCRGGCSGSGFRWAVLQVWTWEIESDEYHVWELYILQGIAVLDWLVRESLLIEDIVQHVVAYAAFYAWCSWWHCAALLWIEAAVILCPQFLKVIRIHGAYFKLVLGINFIQVVFFLFETINQSPEVTLDWLGMVIHLVVEVGWKESFATESGDWMYEWLALVASHSQK